MSQIVYGKIPVKNTLLSKNAVKCIYLNCDNVDQEILSLAKTNKIRVELVQVNKLNQLSSGRNNQGVVLERESYTYLSVDQLLKKCEKNPDSILLMLDSIEDPVNFGSIIRTSACFNIDGIIIGKNRQVMITPTVSKISTGGENAVDICQVVNLSSCIETLKKEKYWIVSTSGDGKDKYDEIDYSGRIALVIGNEGKGISRLVKQHSDFCASIPLSGKLKALNASISTAIFLSEITSFKRHNMKK